MHPYRIPADVRPAPPEPAPPHDPRGFGALHLMVLGGVRVAAACATGEGVGRDVAAATAMLALGFVLGTRYLRDRSRPRIVRASGSHQDSTAPRALGAGRRSAC